ncbi:spore germination protein [Sporomusa aerivorans]|uniref:spore germination protein n=1 Tax=Sporomusa aerivorans TaxID=204936 RepID=UPI00352BAD5C
MDNSIRKAYRYIKDILLYRPPQAAKPFVLEEGADDRESMPARRSQLLKEKALELNQLLEHAYNLRDLTEKAKAALDKGETDAAQIYALAEQLKVLEKRQAELSPIYLSYRMAIGAETSPLSASLEENEKIIEELYATHANKDLVLRKFYVRTDPPLKCMLVFLDGMVDKEIMNISILEPLMVWGNTEKIRDGKDIVQSLIDEYLPNNEVKQINEYQAVREAINSGDTVLFVNGAQIAIVLSTKGYPSRSVGKPTIEQSVRGAQVAFSEGLRINTGLIRSFMPTSDLITEIIPVGKRAPLQCAVMYLKPVANAQLVAEIKRRIKGISTDYITDIGMLEQLIEDHPSMPFPQMLSTERPDRVTPHLSEGRIVLLLQGSPFAHILPINLFTFFHSSEDFSLKVPAGNFMRILRLFSALIAITLPAFYLAINYFHQEALPTELALAIAGARESVPFPAMFEIVLMEISFELIREAGTRIPGLLGSTIGIVGAIIIGQAAVAAHIVSPIMVIIIAITGLASFAIPDFRLAFALRITRFAFLVMAAVLGLVGVAFAFVIATSLLATMKSFGVPYLAPVAPKTVAGLDVVIRGPAYRQEARPDELQTQDPRRQPHLSRKWIKENFAGGDQDDL